MCKDIPHLGIDISDPRFNAKGANILKLNFKRRKINEKAFVKSYDHLSQFIFLNFYENISICIFETFSPLCHGSKRRGN